MISLLTKIKFFMFFMFEWIIKTIRQTSDGNCELLVTNAEKNSKYIWVFSTTIGELNAITSLLNRLILRYPDYGLVLFTDHPHYADSYKAKYPRCIIVSHGSSAHKINFFLDKYPPFLFLLAEIPVVLYDAPCRFSFRVLYELKKRSIPVFTTNSWLYNETPPCKMDRLEYTLFHKDYINYIDLFSVQSTAIKQQLINYGVADNKIHITGNLKFDSLTHNWNIEKTQSVDLLKAIVASKRPCIVAGCVSQLDEQRLLLDMYIDLKQQLEHTLFVLIPRHPEKVERMRLLKTFLEDRHLNYVFKSTISSYKNINFDILIVDTYGELKDFYAISTISYVGYDHNLLEPLMYDKPIIVSNGWSSAYPSYPVYQTLIEKNIILEAEKSGGKEISKLIVDILNKPNFQQTDPKKLLSSLTGATNKNYKILTSYLNEI